MYRRISTRKIRYVPFVAGKKVRRSVLIAKVQVTANVRSVVATVKSQFQHSASTIAVLDLNITFVQYMVTSYWNIIKLQKRLS